MDDAELIAAGETRATCNLNLSPKHNWVESAGGLPEYIHSIACALVRSGKSVESAIEIAVSRVKVWATGKGVNADTQAKAAAALAQWEAKKAKSKKRSSDVAEFRNSTGGSVRPEGSPEDHLFAARIVSYGPPDDWGTSWKKGVFDESLRTKMPKAVWGHDEKRMIGKVTEYRDSDEGLDVIVKLADFDSVPDAKMAYALLREEIADEFSFRFRRQEEEPDPNHRGVTRITKARLEEVSPVLVASGSGTRTLGVRSSSTTRAEATDLLNRVAAGEIDAREALAQLAEMRQKDVVEIRGTVSAEIRSSFESQGYEIEDTEDGFRATKTTTPVVVEEEEAPLAIDAEMRALDNVLSERY